MIAIIPARGGSKGLPGKNIKILGGKPMIAYSILAALKANHVSRVIVSTDCDDIAREALKFGAEVPFIRPSHLATDTALAIDNYLYTIDRLEEEGKSVITEFVVLQPTSPLRISEDIDGAINLFLEKKADSIISYCQEYHPVSWHKKITKEGRIESIFEGKIGNRQQEEPTYFPNGAVYVFDVELIKKRKYFSEESFAYVMSRENSVDIDTLEDFEYAEYLLMKRQKEQN